MQFLPPPATLVRPPLVRHNLLFINMIGVSRRTPRFPAWVLLLSGRTMLARSHVMSTYIDAINSIYGGSSASDSADKTSDTLGKDAFLQLLVTQMQYQDPLDPMKNEDFVAQMAQFSSLEQLMNLNETMGQVALIDSSINNSQAVNLIGKTITVLGDSLDITGGVVSGASYTLADEASEVTISVYDENGALVRSFTAADKTAGNHDLTFDGKDDDGNVLADGSYTFSITAKNSDGDTVESASFSTVKVDGLTFENGVAYLLSGKNRFLMSDIYEVRE